MASVRTETIASSDVKSTGSAKLNKDPTIAQIFESLDYGPAPEGASSVDSWLEEHGKDFGHFVNGKWVKPEGRKVYETRNPSTGEKLASTMQGEQEDIDQAVGAAREAFKSWSKLPGHVRARYLYSIARHVQKHARLLAVLESMDNGKPIRETRDADVQIVARHLYHHAGWAQLMDTEMRDWKPVGVVAAIVPWNFPLMLLCWKVCPALAMGNTVVLKPATYTRLSALLFAEICAEAGLPPGVFNVVTGNGAFGSSLAAHPDVDKVAFTGSTEVGKVLRRLTAGSGKKLSLELGGKSPVVVFDSADLDSTVEGIVDAIWFNQGQVCSAGSRLIVQETCAKQLVDKIKERMTHLRLGHCLDKGIDMGAIVDPSQKKAIEAFVEEARKEGAEVYQSCASMPSNGSYYPPTLITNVQPVSKIVMEEVFGPVLTVLTFRTAKEGIALANNTNYGLGGSVWTENLSLALEVAMSIKAGSVWVNGHNLFDAAAGFGGYRESGFGRDGGKEGLYEYVYPSWQARPRPYVDDYDVKTFGSSVPAKVLNPNSNPIKLPDASSGKARIALPPSIDHTYKVYIGGAQKRPDGNYSRPVLDPKGQVIGQVGEGNRKDIRDAVEAAHKAAPGWGKRAAHNRAQIVYYMAENLELRHSEFSQRLCDMTGCSVEEAKKEVDITIQRLFYWGAYADKYGGAVQETPFYGATVKIHEPVGVIGITCPNSCPLLAFVSLLAPAVIRGNTVVIIPSQKHPMIAVDMYQIFDTSDLPGGVINIVTGDENHLTKYLSEHQDVQAMWYFGSAEGSKFVEWSSAVNVKRTFVNYGNIEILPGKAKANVCSGDNVTFQAGILSSLDILNIYWFQMPPEGVLHLSKNDEHFTMFTNLTYSSLHIRNTLPSLSSDYLLSVQDPNSDLWDNVVFNLKAQDVYLDALVESPIEISLGDDTILKVNKSLKGSLLWTHNGQMVQGMEPHVNFVNGIKTDLRISDAGLEQAGIYEVFLTEDGCEIRKKFDVQIVVIIQILPVKAEAEVCTGDRISMEAEIVTNLDSLQISWSNDEGPLADDQHFTITNNMNHTALEISNTSLSHSGNYTVQALMPNHQQYNDIFRFKLKVLDVNLKALVKSPVEISSGGNASLKVEKSLEGSLLWKHNEEMLQGLEPHYAFSNADKTELEISDASADQAGTYEVILKVSTCELRKVIEVRISDSKDSKFFGIVDKKYLKVLSGNFTGEWHVAPAVLGGLVLIFLVFISCLCWKGDTKKRKMKEENEREEKSTTSPEKGERPTENKRTVQHVALNDPCYTVENEVIYAALVGTDENYSTIDTSVQLVTSSHPKSFSLGLRSPPVSPLS